MRLVLDLGGTHCRSALVDGNGLLDEGTRKDRSLSGTITSRDDLRDLIVGAILPFLEIQAAFVVAVAGPISPDNRVVRKYTNVLVDDHDIPLASIVENEIARKAGKRIRLYVIKDAVAATLAEMGPGGAASNRDEVIALILGTGTGGAPCRRQKDGSFCFPDVLADLGHHQVDPQNRQPCNCGGTGCVELQTSGTGVTRLFNDRSHDAESYRCSALSTERSIHPGSISGTDIAWAAARGDHFTLAILKEAARPLALLLKNVFTSHPDMTVVLVGGFALGVGVPLLELVREQLLEVRVPFVQQERLEEYVRSRVLLGAIPAEKTNLVGAGIFLGQAERSGP
jgi:glucokinase